VDLVIRPGEKIGLVGPLGRGQVDHRQPAAALLRYRGRPHHHRWPGHRPRHQDSLRAQIGMVTQDTSLLHRSVRENITYGRPDASDAEMIHAAERAEAHDFIGTLADAKGRTGLRRPCGRTRREASAWPAPALRLPA
jgi:ATP-binding cassette subfamily B multidrug efflux pump